MVVDGEGLSILGSNPPPDTALARNRRYCCCLAAIRAKVSNLKESLPLLAGYHSAAVLTELDLPLPLPDSCLRTLRVLEGVQEKSRPV